MGLFYMVRVYPRDRIKWEKRLGQESRHDFLNEAVHIEVLGDVGEASSSINEMGRVRLEGCPEVGQDHPGE